MIVSQVVALRKESVDRNVTIIPSNFSNGVALRKESVDRNVKSMFVRCSLIVSLSARRAWIEIVLHIQVATSYLVALRKESVDRNLSNLSVETFR